MVGVVKCLKFTTEISSDFEDNCLPTLDLSLWVKDGKIAYKFFEKPTAASVTVQLNSAMEENCKMKSLSNDVMRGLLNTGRDLPTAQKTRVVDHFSQKLLNSGYRLGQVRKIVLAGIRGYEKKVKICDLARKPLYRTAKDSAVARGRKRILGKSEWFRKRKKQSEQGNMGPGSGGRSGRKAGSYTPRARELRTRSVLFWNTHLGEH